MLYWGDLESFVESIVNCTCFCEKLINFCQILLKVFMKVFEFEIIERYFLLGEII